MFKAPTDSKMPSWEMMRDNLGASIPALAKHLGLAPSTVWRYNKVRHAPRVILLALFFETCWGRSLIATESENELRIMRSMVRCLKDENCILHKQIALLERHLSQIEIVANSPVFEAGKSSLTRARNDATG